jgi:hypothetical protein
MMANHCATSPRPVKANDPELAWTTGLDAAVGLGPVDDPPPDAPLVAVAAVDVVDAVDAPVVDVVDAPVVVVDAAVVVVDASVVVVDAALDEVVVLEPVSP